MITDAVLDFFFGAFTWFVDRFEDVEPVIDITGIFLTFNEMMLTLFHTETVLFVYSFLYNAFLALILRAGLRRVFR